MTSSNISFDIDLSPIETDFFKPKKEIHSRIRSVFQYFMSILLNWWVLVSDSDVNIIDNIYNRLESS